jgi:hypothetical protein
MIAPSLSDLCDTDKAGRERSKADIHVRTFQQKHRVIDAATTTCVHIMRRVFRSVEDFMRTSSIGTSRASTGRRAC